MVRLFDETAYGETSASFCAPFPWVEYEDGDSADERGHEIAPSVFHGARELEDPRL